MVTTTSNLNSRWRRTRLTKVKLGILEEQSEMLTKLRRKDCMYTGKQLAEIFRVANLRTRNLDGSKI